MLSDRRSVGWDIQAAATNYLSLVCAQATSVALGLAAVWLATRLIGPSGYGQMVALVAASQFAHHAGLHWTALSLIRFGCEEFVRTGRIGDSFWTRGGMLAVNSTVLLATSVFWFPPLSRWVALPRGTGWLVALHLAALAVSTHLQYALQAAKLPARSAWFIAGDRGLTVLILIVLSQWGARSWVAVVLAFVLAPFLSSIRALLALRATIWPFPPLELGLVKKMLSYSYPLILFCWIGYLSTNHLDTFFIVRFLSTADLAVYSLAYQVAGVFMQLPALAGTLMMSLLVTAHTEGAGARRGWTEQTGALPAVLVVWSLSCALVAFAAGALLPPMFGPAFSSLPRVIWPLMVAAALAAPQLVAYSPFANSRSATGIATLAAMAAALVNVAGNAWLVPRFGLAGCGWATALAFGVSSAVSVAYLSRRFGFGRLSDLVSTLPVLGGAIAFAVSGTGLALGVTLLCALAQTFVHRQALSIVGRRFASEVLRSGGGLWHRGGGWSQ
jgi:O-antigen/teichoic acid export membrane protein